MEKLTIGKFICVLRRGNGMTQKELGERLYVSDKTVSRWERDECTPDLSLVPAIADIFGITTDELLRGEKSRVVDEDVIGRESAQKQKGIKGDKQFKAMLNTRMTKFKSYSFISVGITIAGLIAAMICNLGFLRGIIGFCVGSVFILSSIICQMRFMANAWLRSNYENECYDKEIKKVNAKIAFSTIKLIFVNVGIFGFILPIGVLTDGAYSGLAFGWWFWYGVLFSVTGLVLAYAIYALAVRKYLVARGILFYNDREIEIVKKNNKSLKKYLVIFASVASVLAVELIVVNSLDLSVFAEPEVFNNYDDFKNFMSDINNGDASGSFDDWCSFSVIMDDNGNILCEYEDTYFIGRIECSFDNGSKDGLPIKVYTDDIFSYATHVRGDINTIIVILLVTDFIVCVITYIVKVRRNYKMGVC